MKTLFYPKLAVNGMKKNKRLYLPYILTLVAMVMMMYITAYLARSENIANTNRGVYAQWCLWFFFSTATLCLSKTVAKSSAYTIFSE